MRSRILFSQFATNNKGGFKQPYNSVLTISRVDGDVTQPSEPVEPSEPIDPTQMLYPKFIVNEMEGDYSNDRVDVVGDYAFYHNDKLITVNFPAVTTINNYAFNFCENLEVVNFPSAITVKNGAFGSCLNIKVINMPLAETIDQTAFNSNNHASLEQINIQSLLNLPMNLLRYKSKIVKLQFNKLTNIERFALQSAESLETLIIKTEKVCTLENTNAFGTSTPIALGTGYIYVPSKLIDSYKSDTQWSTYASQFRTIEDYPDICGGEVV